MAKDASKIHVGAGDLTLNPGTDDIDGGFCSEGATLSYKAGLKPIEVDQELAAVGFFVPGEECQFETILSEASATKLKYAIGSANAVVHTAATGSVKESYQLDFGGETVLTEYSLKYSAPKRTNRNLYITVFLRKVNISPQLEIAYKKDKPIGFKLTALAFADTTQIVGKKLGYYLEEVADVTGTTPTLAISSVVPADAATGVSVSASIVVTFNRPVDPASCISANFALVKATGTCDGVACTVTRTAANVVTVTPNSAMSGTQLHVFVVASDVEAMDDKTKMAANGYYNFTTT
jgi:hypothetical protein